MPTNTMTGAYCWKDISFLKAVDYSGVISYLEKQKELPGFPFVIFSDHIPAASELLELLTSEQMSNRGKRPLIIALHPMMADPQAECWKLLASGITDIVGWEEAEDLIRFLDSTYRRRRELQDHLDSPLVRQNLVGESSVWRNFLSDVVEATIYSHASILLIGESGTGKELISRLVHTLDRRPEKKKLIIVDCTTIVPELSGSELFGHERGSYTNAVQSREGAVALANGGTLFLDEIGELPPALQAELLRALQEGTYKRVGSNTWQKSSFRLVCATNKELATPECQFRQDLYYRIADCEFRVPSLQERKEDIPLLVNSFLSGTFPEGKRPQMDKLVMDYLTQRNYPGNVRELKQLVQRIALKHVEHKKITIGEVPLGDRAQLCTGERPQAVSDGMTGLIRNALLTGENWWNLKNRISETAIQVALDLEGNNKQKAAERLGVDVRTVQQYTKKKELAVSSNNTI
jgi:transcriptional regulator with GAF, ATPase, and Fis domain